jgi:hypothetical protein
LEETGMPYTDSATATGGVTFQGLWIHDPLDAEGTIRQHLYGAAQRSLTAAVEHSGTVYAGREYPVFDWGDQRAEEFAVRVDVPHGTSWQDDMDALKSFAENQRTTTVRDSRGRSITGAVAGYSEDDQLWGTRVSFTVTRAHEETVTV